MAKFSFLKKKIIFPLLILFYNKFYIGLQEYECKEACLWLFGKSLPSDLCAQVSLDATCFYFLGKLQLRLQELKVTAVAKAV